MNNFVIETLEYDANSANLLHRLAELSGLVMLDSGKSQEHDQRYDILSALPLIRLAQDGDKLVCIDQEFNAPLNENIFDAAIELLDRFRPEQYPKEIEHLPFLGGAIA